MAFLKTKPGDIFAIPAHNATGEIGFVACRHIALKFDVPLFEVFRRFYTAPIPSLAEADTSARLFRPVMMLLTFDKIGIPTKDKWRILFSDPNYDKSQSNFEKIQIGYLHGGGPDLYTLWEGGVDRRVPFEIVSKVEAAEWWVPMHISMRVSAHLAGLIGPTEQYSYYKVAGLEADEANRPAMMEVFHKNAARALHANEVMAARFKAWDAAAKAAKRRK
jgi:hypothetical protein